MSVSLTNGPYESAVSTKLMPTSGSRFRTRRHSARSSGSPYAGTDFIIARDGRIAAVYLFFDKLR
jgi:hypothetical protein